MFLGILNEEEKQLFVSLCMHGVTIGGKSVNNYENTIMQAFCAEMRMPQTIKCDQNLDNVLDEINEKCDDRSKRVMILELLGLMQADGTFSDDKKEFMKKLVNRIDIAEATYVMLSKLWSDYKEICQDLYATIEGE